MKLAAEIVAVLILVVPIVVFGYLFIWTARKDARKIKCSNVGSASAARLASDDERA